MLKGFLRTGKYLLIAALCISSCAMTGCIESSFELASESRLPISMALPPGLSRADVSVTLNYCTTLPGSRDAKFILRDRKGKELAEIKGKVKNLYPLYLKSCPQRFYPGCPAYEVVAVNSITEIIKNVPYREHEQMEQNGRVVALFYVIDDPAVRKEFLADRSYVQKK
jgi:hypothetical protein